MAKNSPYIVFGLLTILLCFSAFQKPYYNWDMLGYVASAKAMGGASDQQAHQYAYENVEQYTNEKTRKALVRLDDEYRGTMATDHELFAQQLPYYKIRVLYNFSIMLLDKIGFNPYFASHFISVICVFSGILILGLILFDVSRSKWLNAFFPLLLISIGVVNVARFSTPDGMAFLVTTLIALLLHQNKNKALFIILPIAIAVRTDLIILVAALSIYYIFFDKANLKWYLLSAAAALVVYFAINSYYGNYGWHTVFYVTLVKMVVNPADLELTVTPALYFEALTRGLSKAISSNTVIIYMIFSIMLLINHIKKYRAGIKIESIELVALHYISLIYYLVHFLLFPVIWKRFYAAQYAIALILILSLISATMANRKKKVVASDAEK